MHDLDTNVCKSDIAIYWMKTSLEITLTVPLKLHKLRALKSNQFRGVMWWTLTSGDISSKTNTWPVSNNECLKKAKC